MADWRRGVGRSLLVAALAGCTAGPGSLDVPTEAAARDVLAGIVEAAQRRDAAALCAFGDANCPDVLNAAGLDAVPAAPPTLAGTRVVAATPTTVGGLVLQLCGVDGRGAPYATEMLVVSTDRGLRAIQPVYWSGLRIPAGAEVGANEPLAFGGCPAPSAGQ